MRYLLHFVQEHVPFRWPEFLAVTSRNDCKFHLISKHEHIITRPYLLIQLKQDSSEESLIKSARETYLLKGLYEMWAESEKSLEDLSSEACKSAPFLSDKYSKPDQTFRINCETFGVKTSQSAKIEMIKKMVFMDKFECRPNLVNPRQTYCILEMNERSHSGALRKEYYFGRLLATGNRKIVDRLSLRNRIFIANTSMNPLLSLIAANTAKVKKGDIVYDPFVGSGSLLVAAAYMGASVIGSDIDWLLLHGKSKPSRVGMFKRDDGENIRANMRQYGLESKYLDVLVSDISRRPFQLDKFRLDSIITDPPYGIRECSERIGKRPDNRVPKAGKGMVRYPTKVDYNIEDLLKDLLQLAAEHLIPNGRLIYFLPVTKDDEHQFVDFIPRHPCLELISFSEQALTSRNYRLMVVMEKTREPGPGDGVSVPRPVLETNFRETYFNEDRQPKSDCATGDKQTNNSYKVT